MKKIISWSLVIIWMALIFYFSSMNSIKSSNTSKGLIYNIVNTLNNSLKLNIDVDNFIEKTNVPVRKISHFTIYFILAIFLVNALLKYNIDISKIFIISLLICFIYSITDEYHQLFVDGRSGEILDVLIDTFGSLLYILLFYIKRRYKKLNSKNSHM